MISWCWPLVGLWCKLGFCSCTVLLQKKPVRESTQRQMSCSSSGSLSPSNQAANAPKQTSRREWKYIASEKTTSKCVINCMLFVAAQSPETQRSGGFNLRTFFSRCLITIFNLPSDNTYLCLAVLDGMLCVIFLHGRSSPQTSPSATPCLMKSLSFEAQPEELEEHPLSPMHYARSGLGTAALNGRLIAAGWY